MPHHPLDLLSAIRETPARVAKASRILTDTAPEQIVRAIHREIVRARRTAHPDALAALDAIAVALTARGRISYHTTSALYAAAVADGLTTVARLLFGATATTASAPPPSDDLEEERPAHPGGKPLPLGTRKWLARRSRSDALSALARDPHPAVITNLLASPAITERDVLAIASRRPTQPSCQLAIFESDRWRARHAVRRALALNPHTPVPLAARIMTTLRAADLRDIAAAPNLSAILRDHARELEALARPERD